MKRLWPSILWFCAGAVLGQFAESVLFPLWSKLGFVFPVTRWLASFAPDTLLKCWLIVYIGIVSWLIVALVGVIGGLFIKRDRLLRVLLFGCGFAYVPLALYAYLNSYAPTFADYLQHTLIVGIAVMCAHYGRRCGLGYADRAA
jgi:hypothetical protein